MAPCTGTRDSIPYFRRHSSGDLDFFSVQTGSPAIAGQKQARNMVLLAAGILMNFVGGVPCIKAP